MISRSGTVAWVNAKSYIHSGSCSMDNGSCFLEELRNMGSPVCIARQAWDISGTSSCSERLLTIWYRRGRRKSGTDTLDKHQCGVTSQEDRGSRWPERDPGPNPGRHVQKKEKLFKLKAVHISISGSAPNIKTVKIVQPPWIRRQYRHEIVGIRCFQPEIYHYYDTAGEFEAERFARMNLNLIMRRNGRKRRRHVLLGTDKLYRDNHREMSLVWTWRRQQEGSV